MSQPNIPLPNILLLPPFLYLPLSYPPTSPPKPQNVFEKSLPFISRHQQPNSPTVLQSPTITPMPCFHLPFHDHNSYKYELLIISFLNPAYPIISVHFNSSSSKYYITLKMASSLFILTVFMTLFLFISGSATASEVYETEARSSCKQDRCVSMDGLGCVVCMCANFNLSRSAFDLYCLSRLFSKASIIMSAISIVMVLRMIRCCNTKVEKQSYLSHDLITQEILTRLPVKSIFRFKSVSKHWYFILSSSNFSKAHLMKSPSFLNPCAPLNTLFIKAGSNYYLFRHHDDVHVSPNIQDDLVKLNDDFSGNRSSVWYFYLTGSCNGLICLTHCCFKYFVLWNPATHKMHTYSAEFVKSLEFGTDVYANCLEFIPDPAFGFGYASCDDDYKYVRVQVHMLNSERNILAHIFCVKANKWRVIEYDDDAAPYGQGKLVNETLYWSPRGGRASEHVVSFDLGSERFKVINLNFNHLDFSKFEVWSHVEVLGVMGDCLSLCISHHKLPYHKSMHIFKSPPEIMTCFGLPEEMRLDNMSQIIGCTKCGKFFVKGPTSYIPNYSVPISETLKIVYMDVESAKCKTLFGFQDSIDITRYFPTLVSPAPVQVHESSEAYIDNHHVTFNMGQRDLSM